MRLDSEFLQLPLRFDTCRLAAEIAQIEESAWRPHPQGHPGNSALPLVAVRGDPDDDQTRGPMRATPHLQRLPYTRQVFAAMAGVVGRSRLMRLDGNAEATPHADTNYYWRDHARVHVPVVTTPGVTFHCGERQVHMAAGECWLFDTWRRHNVVNPVGTRRIHLVMDTVGSAAFRELMRLGRDPFAVPAPAFAPRDVVFDATAAASFELESFNHPVVMSPWELDATIALLLDDLDDGDDRSTPAARLGLHAAARRLQAGWRAIWAADGDLPRGWPRYRELLAQFEADIAPHAVIAVSGGIGAVEALRHYVLRAALNPDLAGTAAAAPEASAAATTRAVASTPVAPMTPATSVTATAVAPSSLSAPTDPAARVDAALASPVFIVSPPRSGSTLLFETLARSPGFATIGGESHEAIEGIASLDPRNRGHDSNRLVQRDATPDVVAALRERFAARLRDRDGRPPAQWDRPLTLLEKTPKNALRIPFLAEAFPNARFVYLYRDARETVSSMLDAWRSRRFVTYPDLPGWPDSSPWSLLLTPGWREWTELPLPEVVARQWSETTRRLLDDLQRLPPETWCVASYDRLIQQPQAEMLRLTAFLDMPWDQVLTSPLPNARHTLTSPQPEKWKHNADELAPVMSLVAAQANRAHQVFGTPPATRAAKQAAPAPTAPVPAVANAPSGKPDAPAPGTPFNFGSVHTATFPQLLAALGSSLAVTTYQSGRVVLLRADGGALNTHLRAFPNPMGMAQRGATLALGTQTSVWYFNDQPAAAAALVPRGRHDACFVPARAHVTGDVRMHEMAYAGDALWFVNTRFSCLATLDGEHSFVPRWRPRFVSALAPEDRCHLNGMAVVDGRVRYASALGTANTPQGWRERKADGGCVIDVDSGEIVASGLCMPHSPRVHDGRAWILESGKGTLCAFEPGTGRVETVATLPGFTRGLAFAGPYAFVGLSQVRESVFEGVPVAQREHERHCGVWVVDIRSGSIVAFLRFSGDVREVFDVQLLAGLRWPDLLEPDDERIAGSFLLPQDALAEVRI